MKQEYTVGKVDIWNGILTLGILGVGVVFLYLNLVQYKIGINADIASEGMLAKVIWETKEWVPKDWYFSTEARVLSVANLAALFYGLTRNISLSMGLSCITAGIFIVGSVWFLCKELEMSKTQKLLVVFLTMIVPNNKVQLELMFLFAGHYAIHISLYFLTLGYYVKLLKREKNKGLWIGTLALYLLHFLIGIQGVRGILMITGPLMVVEGIRFFTKLRYGSKWEKEDYIVSGVAFGLNAVGYLGSKFPISIGHPLSRNIRKAPEKLYEKVFPDFLDTFSWYDITYFEKIAVFVCLALMVLTIINMVVKFVKKEEFKIQEWVWLNFFVSVMLTMAALTFTTIDSSSRYFVAVYFVITFNIVFLWEKKNKVIKSMFIFFIGIIFIGTCIRWYYPLMTEKHFQNNEYVQISDYLYQEGYENGYAIFEHANPITVMGDGKVQVSAVSSLSNMEVCKWLSYKGWYVPRVSKESKTAYIVTDYGMEEFEPFLENHKDTVEFQTKIGIYHIYSSKYNYSKLTD